MNDKKILKIARDNIDKIKKIRVINEGHKFYVKDPEKIKFWLMMCQNSEKEAGNQVPRIYLSKLDLK